MPHDPRPADAATLPPISPTAPFDFTTVPPSGHPPADTVTLPPGPAAGSLLAGPPVPGFAIEGELGRGGMGVVYRARQLALNRPVALKMVLSGAHADPKDLVRFLAEAEAVAAVQHPHVVQVYEFGEHDGRPYFAMEYLEGGSLAGLVRDRGKLTPAEAAALVEKCARGVQAAHDLGIVHRDLKPANILLATDGSPKVTDFGLAKRGGQSDLTRTGAVMGTPAYMAPEQAKGEGKFVGPGADVYALGVILFECLAGRPPFQAGDTVSLIMKVATEEAPPVRRFAPEVSRDLDLICRNCLGKAPADRYPTAAALADDLGRFLAGEPVTVRPAGPVERLAKWARRKPTLAAAYGLTGAAVVLVGLAAAASWLWQRAEGAREVAVGEREQAEMARGQAVAARDEAEGTRDQLAAQQQETEKARAALAAAQRRLVRVEYARSLDLAHREWKENNLERARALLAGCPPDLRGWEWRYVHRLCHADLRTVRTPALEIRPVACRPDGRYILAAELGRGSVWLWESGTADWRKLPGDWGQTSTATFSPDGRWVVAVGQDRTARVCGLRPGDRPVLLAAAKDVSHVAFAPDGRRLVTVGSDGTRLTGGTAHVWQADSGELRVAIKLGSLRVATAAFSPDGERITTVDDGGGIRVSKATTGDPVLSLAGHAANVDFAAVSKDGARVVTRTREGVTQVREVKAGATPVTLGAPPHRGHTGLFSPDGSLLVTSTQDGVVAVWDARTAVKTVTLADSGQTFAREFSPDGARVLTAGEDGVVRVWDARTGVEQLVLKGHVGRVGGAAFGPAGDRVVTTGVDGTVRVWDAVAGPGPVIFTGDNRAKRAALSPDGERVAIPRTDDTVQIRDLRTGKEVTLKGHTYIVDGIAFSPDGSRVATASADWTAAVWDARTGETLHILKGHHGPVFSVAFSPDGGRVVTGGLDKTARLWDARTGAAERTLEGHGFGVAAAAFGPAGDRVVTASADGTAAVWDARTGTRLRVLSPDSINVLAAAFSPDGARVVTADESGAARVWDAATGALVVTLEGHQGRVHSASFGPDGTRVITAGDDGTVKVWDAEAGVEALTLHGHRGWVYHAAFARTGNRVVTCGADGTVRVWDARPLNDDFFPREAGPPARVVRPAAGPKAPPPVPTDLLGEWAAEAVMVHGKSVRVPDEARTTLVFTADGKLTMTQGKGERTAAGTFTADPTKDPAEIDLHPAPGTKRPSKLGIYRVDGDVLTLCYSEAFMGERPRRFESPKGSDLEFSTWKRVKKD